MSERGDYIDQKLAEIFNSPDADGFMLQTYDSEDLTPEEIRNLVEKLVLLKTVGTHCFICGDQFDADGALTCIGLGPIESDGSVAEAHKECFDQKCEEKPEIGQIIGKKWYHFSQEEKMLWISTFSSVDQQSTYGNLFTPDAMDT